MFIMWKLENKYIKLVRKYFTIKFKNLLSIFYKQDKIGISIFLRLSVVQVCLVLICEYCTKIQRLNGIFQLFSNINKQRGG